MRLLALYLPQYHAIEENDRWWGKGYTEWTAVKQAKTLCDKHIQPHVPLNENYYDLSDESGAVWKWQAELAEQYGIYGFCIYHYWFGEKMLLQKPMEILLRHPEINLKYTICWANETWTRVWYAQQNEVLMEQTYGGEEEWIRHYEYLRPFFQDERYIKIDGKPLIHILRQGKVTNLDAMLRCWQDLAVKDGFSGIRVIAARKSVDNEPLKSDLIDGEYLFEPGYSSRNGMTLAEKLAYFGEIEFRHLRNLLFRRNDVERLADMKAVNRRILRNYENEKKKGGKPVYAGACPNWDNTPRRGSAGSVFYNTTPEEFRSLLLRLKQVTDEEEFVYADAWNEWGEGCYLEPDTVVRYAYLEAVRDVQKGKG